MNMDLSKVKRAVEPEVIVNHVSRISDGTVIKGELSSDCDVRIDGQVEGKLFSKGRIVVGPQAKLVGGLACQNVDFWGTMTGDIFVKDVLTVKNKAVIEGNINVNKLQVEMGASINGSCHMITPEEYDKLCESFVTTKLAAKAAPAPKK